MKNIIQLLENTLVQNGYRFTVGCIEKDEEYQYFFWNDNSPIVYGCSFNPDKTDEYANVGALEISKMPEEPVFGCYTGWLKDNLTEDRFHFCIAEVTRMVKHELESEVYDEDMRSVLRLGNHTTDIEAYFSKYGYQKRSKQKSLAPHTDYLDGAYYDAETQTATLGIEMFEEFRKFCVQEAAAYDVVKKTDKNVVCSVKESVINFFVKCMQSEKSETIRMLCMLPKEMLTMRLNDGHFEAPAEQWVERVDIKLITEALKRYDDPEFAVEREAMSCK